MSTVKELRNRRLMASSGVVRQTLQPVKSAEIDTNFGLNIIFGLCCGFLGFVFALLVERQGLGMPKLEARHYAIIVGVVSAGLLWFKPYLQVLGSALLQGRRPAWDELTNKHSPAERMTAHIMLALALTGIYDYFYPTVRVFIAQTVLPFFADKIPSLWQQTAALFSIRIRDEGNGLYYQIVHPDAILSWSNFALLWLVLIFFVGFCFVLLTRSAQRATHQKKVKSEDSTSFSLWIGQSTGLLAKQGHPASLKPNQQVGLELTEACQNLLILGGIGSGKTSRVIHPLLIQLLDQHCGGLIFDIKGDFHVAVKEAAALTNRTYQIIGPGFMNINLLEGLTPALAASMLKSGFLLSNAQMDGFWVDTAAELCRNALGLLVHVPEHYTLRGLYDYIFVDEFKLQIFEVIERLFPNFSENERRALLSNQRYGTEIFEKFDEKVKSGVRATCAQILSPFSQIELMDAFCKADSESLPWTSLLDGNLFLVNLPSAQWGLGAKLAYTFLKLRFFNIMQRRALTPEWNQTTPVFFMCDEYQDIISASKEGLNDLSFWDKARSSKTIGIISSQSIASFYAAIGDVNIAKAILQNFRQRLCFRTEDELTIEHFEFLAGQAEIVHTSHAQATHKGGAMHTEKSRTLTKTVTPHRKSVIDSQLFRTLGDNQVIALLNLANGFSADDVLLTQPVYFESA